MPYSEETTDDLIINLMLNTPYNPETAEPNQVYLTPDTTDQDIADAISAHNTSNTAHTDIRNAIPTKTSDLTNDSNFATVSQIPTNNNQLTNGAGYITSASLPTKVSDLTNDSGYITGINSSDVTNALGYTPYNSSIGGNRCH